MSFTPNMITNTIIYVTPTIIEGQTNKDINLIKMGWPLQLCDRVMLTRPIFHSKNDIVTCNANSVYASEPAIVSQQTMRPQSYLQFESFAPNLLRPT